MRQFTPFSLNIKGQLWQIDRPQVMGILNVTPDSFYDGSRTPVAEAIEARVTSMLADGVDIIDIGGCSTRPGFEAPDAAEEWRRVSLGISQVRRLAPDIPVSVDTYRGDVARRAIDAGADIINDISAFTLDDTLLQAVTDLNVPYILTHPSASSLTPEDTPAMTVGKTLRDLQHTLAVLTAAGVSDVIVDPGFGFGKTVGQNYALMRDLDAFHSLGRPLLVGISRKSMIYKPLGLTPADSLPGTVALNTYAMMHGAAIIRVHDVAAARQCVDTLQLLQ